MTVREHLRFYASIRGVPEDDVDGVVFSLMDRMHLSMYANRLATNLSGGNKRKLCVAIALIGDPPVVLLDEPSTGVDPESRCVETMRISKGIIQLDRKNGVCATNFGAGVLCTGVSCGMSCLISCLEGWLCSHHIRWRSVKRYATSSVSWLVAISDAWVGYNASRASMAQDTWRSLRCHQMRWTH